MPKIAKTDVFEIATSGSIGPAKVGSRLSDIGDMLGPPRYWGFPNYDDFDAYMGFGGVEIGFELCQNHVQIRYIKFDLALENDLTIPFCHGGRFGYSLSIKAPSLKARRIESIRRKLLRNGVIFSELLDETIPEDTSSLISFPSGVRFYFSKDDGNPLITVGITDITMYKDSPFNK